MVPAVGSYCDWVQINYEPVVTSMLPFSLLPYLADSQRILDVGCNKGDVAIFLAEQGYDVWGVDLNSAAIDMARQQATRSSASNRLHFLAADFLKEPMVDRFGVVIMIRLLTCFPNQTEWHELLQRVHDVLLPGGIVYIRDFLLYEESEDYHKRYQAGMEQGWRPGNFAVADKTGEVQFIAHHHSEEELDYIAEAYDQIERHYSFGFSMNGHPCRMFEFIGRKLSREDEV